MAARYLIAIAAIAGCVIADDSAYAAPAVSYGAPAAEYGAPPAAEYGAPSDGYGAPADAYGAPQQYAEYDTAYAQETTDGGAFDLSQITELLPLFLAVFAAIIVAQLFAPLLGMLFGAKIDLANGLLAPLSGAKIDLINAILAPFNLVLGNVGTCTPATGRSLGGSDWNVSPDNVLSMIFKANEIYNQL